MPAIISIHMFCYNLDPRVEAFSTNIGDVAPGIVLPLHQAHGVESRLVCVPEDAEGTWGVDALFTQMPGLAIGVKTADCVPILLYDPESQTVGAIHSGWKGTAANIIAHTISHMQEACGTNPQTMKALIGPCIHFEAFEVGDELIPIFTDAGYADFCRRATWQGREKWHIDLPGICRKQLNMCGVRDVEVRDECTYTLHHQFYSARRLGPEFKDQRIITAIKILS